MKAKIIMAIGLGAALYSFSSPTMAQSAGDGGPATSTVPSEFREGVVVEFLYRQDLEDVYSTTWLGRLESSDGLWRDVYFETSEGSIAHGIMSFECFADDMNGEPAIGITEYTIGSYADSDNRRLLNIFYNQRTEWASGTLEELMGADPPYELFVVAHYRFCGDPRLALKR